MEVGAIFWLALFAATVVYWALPRGRDWFLILASATYLAWISPWAVLLPCGWYAVICLLRSRMQLGVNCSRRTLGALLAALLAYLAFFKYVPALTAFAQENFGIGGPTLDLLLPLGISYYTFKLIHYSIEVSRGNIPEHPPRLLLIYLLMFTVFPAGPIERFDDFLANRQKTWGTELLTHGLTRIIYGLIKKFCIAENLVMPLLSWRGLTTNEVLIDLEMIPVALVWIHLALWFLYFYLDFSAYSDIAIGASRLFGFKIQENFNHPLLATDIGDFWQRWHMSLARWCRAYVYMPLIGATRNPYVAVFATMLTFALWHKASLNWLLWGAFQATGLIIFGAYLRFKRRRKISPSKSILVQSVSRLATFGYVSASYAFLVTAPIGVYPGVQLFAKLFGVYLPA